MARSTNKQNIRSIFLHREPYVSTDAAAQLLGRSREELLAMIDAGEMEVVVDRRGSRIPRAELVNAALVAWSAEVIENALGADASDALPRARRLVEFHARLPRYHVAILRYLAAKERTTANDILARQIEALASESSEEFAAAIPDFAAAFAWPDLPNRRV
jgi:excisionase family DNA binding protein